MTTWILMLTIVIGEVHTFWEKRPEIIENWFIARWMPLPVQQNVWLSAQQLNFILYFLAFYFYGKNCNRVNTSTVVTFIWFCVIDSAALFYNYKTFNYYIVYFLLALIWGVYYKYYFWKRFKTK
jgi:hypothetical protein